MFLLGAPVVFAAEHENEAEEVHAGEEEHAKHTLGIVAGVTREGDENHETFGFEYSYHINHTWSVGGIIERAEREKESALALAFVHWWPHKGWYLGAGLGRKDPADTREKTFRSTIGYEFVFEGGWVTTLEANLDAIEHHDSEQVYVIGFGRKF